MTLGDAAFNWTAAGNTFNTWCHYRQEDVAEPGCVCPVYLRSQGYPRVRATDTCVSYFDGRIPEREERPEFEFPEIRMRGRPRITPVVVVTEDRTYHVELCGEPKLYQVEPRIVAYCTRLRDLQPDGRLHIGYHRTLMFDAWFDWRNRLYVRPKKL